MFTVYILRCGDGSFYTGITNNLENRLKQHASGKGSKYVRSRLPFKLVYLEKILSKSEALKMEFKIKSMSRKEKLSLIEKQ